MTLYLPDPPADGSRQTLQPPRDNDCRLSRHAGLGSSLFARHYSGSLGFFPFLRVLRCFSSPACLSYPMYSARTTRALPRVGFPIRRSRDQRLVSTSPALIAAAHVLHRLLAPRHPPCALVLLIEKNTLCVAMEFSRCSGPEAPKRKPPIEDGLSKLSSDCLLRGQHNYRRPGCSRESIPRFNNEP